MITTKILENDEFPYRIQFNGLYGIAKSPSSAVIRALHVGGKVPHRLKNRNTIRKYILNTYSIDRDWVYITQILEEDKF